MVTLFYPTGGLSHSYFAKYEKHPGLYTVVCNILWKLGMTTITYIPYSHNEFVNIHMHMKVEEAVLTKKSE